MAGINKVIIVGNLGRDPEMRQTQSGSAVANFTVATTRQWSGQDGQKQEETEWHRIVTFGRLAEICGQYLHKGKQVYLEGRMQTRKWQDKEGKDRWTTEIVANEMQMLGRRGEGDAAPAGASFGDASQEAPAPRAAETASGSMGGADDDLPF